MTILRIKKLPNFPQDCTLQYQTLGSAGFDLFAAKEVQIMPGEYALIPTGMAIALEMGFEAQIRPRSGLALKNGITVLNSPGTIDCDYRGEICIILINHSKSQFNVNVGMRIAQMVIASYQQAKMVFVQDLDETIRGSSGFGSTGV